MLKYNSPKTLYLRVEIHKINRLQTIQSTRYGTGKKRKSFQAALGLNINNVSETTLSSRLLP
jgi:hypothetical protein